MCTKVPAAQATPERLEHLRRYAVEAVGPAVDVVARYVDTIEVGPGGKFRPAVSRVHTDYPDIDWSDLSAPRNLVDPGP